MWRIRGRCGWERHGQLHGGREPLRLRAGGGERYQYDVCLAPPVYNLTKEDRLSNLRRPPPRARREDASRRIIHQHRARTAYGGRRATSRGEKIMGGGGGRGQWRDKLITCANTTAPRHGLGRSYIHGAASWMAVTQAAAATGCVLDPAGPVPPTTARMRFRR